MFCESCLHCSPLHPRDWSSVADEVRRRRMSNVFEREGAHHTFENSIRYYCVKIWLMMLVSNLQRSLPFSLTCGVSRPHGNRFTSRNVSSLAYKVNLETKDGSMAELEVPEGESILSVAIDQGLDLPHDCKLGVCMNCAARLVSGEVDQSAGMLRDDVQEKGYTLLCIAIPQTDVDVKVIEEEELLAEVMDA
jgi:ferredoxin